MIKMVYLDDRLIHGQYAVKWSNALQANRIIVADDDSANNAIMKKALMTAAPPEGKTFILPVDKAIEMCADPRADALKIILVVGTPENMLKVVQNLKGIERINSCNFGHYAFKQDDEERTEYGRNLLLSPEEKAVMDEVVATGIPATMQYVPEHTPQDLKEVLSK